MTRRLGRTGVELPGVDQRVRPHLPYHLRATWAPFAASVALTVLILKESKNSDKYEIWPPREEHFDGD